MPRFNVRVYQEFYADHVVEAETEEEATALVGRTLAEDHHRFIWEPSSEAPDIADVEPVAPEDT